MHNSAPKVLELPRSATEDIVGDTYKIQLNEEISALSNDFCSYYKAVNIEDHAEFLAIKLDNKFLHPVEAIHYLYANEIDGLNQILGYGIVTLSTTKEEHLVVIVNYYDPQANLFNYLEAGNSLNLAEIESMIYKITEVLEKLQTAGIYGCNIDLRNILLKDGKFFGLREFINSYTRFHQNFTYLAPEIVECHPAARYISSIKSDVYALGICAFEAYVGHKAELGYQNSTEYNNARFENGTVKSLNSKVKLPEKLKVFLKWCLHDEADLRWDINHLKDWLKNKNAKPTHESLIATKNTIGFNGNNYSRAKSIANALFVNWQEGGKFIQDNKLLKWARRENFSNEVLEDMALLVGSKSEGGYMPVLATGGVRKLAKMLALLDPSGPIRKAGLAFTAASIPQFLYYLMANNKKDLIKTVLEAISDEEWLLYEKNLDAAGHINPLKADFFKNAAGIYSNNSEVKGPERAIYNINPYAVCLSNLVKSYYVNNVAALLDSLNHLVKKHAKKLNLDKQIVAFVASKLDLQDNIRPVILPSFPKFAEHPAVKSLSVINLLQQHEPDINLENISHILVEDLVHLFEEYLHNVEFKEKVVTSMREVAKDGKIAKIINHLSNQQQFIDDYNGYYEACREAKILEGNVKLLQNEDRMYNNSLLIGQKTTVLLSYVLCFIVIVTMI